MRIAEALPAEPVEPVFKVFPDGESYFRLPGVEGEEVVLIQGTHPPQDQHLMQLFFLVSGLRDAGAERVRVVVPYLAYARQDRAFLQGEVVSLSVILRLMRSVGIEELITINPHSPWALESASLRSVSLDAVGVVTRYVMEMGLRDPVVISPGKKGEEMSRAAASMLGAEYSSAVSSRDRHSGEVRVSIGDVRMRGRDVLVIDDLVSTGGTMALTVAEAKRRGAERVVAACIHGLFLGDAYSRILAAGAERVLSTDTVPSSHSAISVAGMIASHLSRKQ